MPGNFAIALVDFHVIIDDRTQVRPMHLADAEEVYQLIVKNREHLYPWMAWVPDEPYTREMTRDYIRYSEKAAREQTQFDGLIERDGHIIGSIGFPIIDWRNRIAHIGYWLDLAHTGHGIMTAAVRALTRYGFEALELNRIEIRCDVENERSAAVAQRLGYKLEGRLRQAMFKRDRYVDDFVFSMLREEWEATP